jgi:hypothetical protein
MKDPWRLTNLGLHFALAMIEPFILGYAIVYWLQPQGTFLGEGVITWIVPALLIYAALVGYWHRSGAAGALMVCDGVAAVFALSLAVYAPYPALAFFAFFCAVAAALGILLLWSEPRRTVRAR